MKCSQCKTENPEKANFCKNCQAPLNNRFQICPHGHHYETHFRSCPHCPKVSSVAEPVTGGIGRSGKKKPDETVVDDGKVKLSPSTPQSSRQNDPSSRSVADSDRTMIYTNQSGSGAQGDKSGQINGSNKAVPQYVPRKLVGWLVTYDLDPIGIDYKLTVGRQRIGRDSRCEIVINDPAISSEHAVLLYREGQVIIQDSLSANGTYVNEELVIERKHLSDNDLIRLGQVRFKLKLI